MPPKLQITKDMIINAGIGLIRQYGEEALNVRRIASELKCSTQPVMYQFATVDELKSEIYSAADKYHSEYILSADPQTDDPMLSIGMNYIRFAYEEKKLFRFLFQSDKYANSGISELIDNSDIAPVFDILSQETGLSHEQSKDAFSALFLTVHGIASLLANNSMEYDAGYFEKTLTNVFMGVIGAISSDENNER
ncbi:MAG: TetR/AcrR family transcriptional regulator [Oscillospiraceae bacterium]|nr:TetR/AcrR family transcriptional regulator [Oscillospiraceae bacterium]